MKLSENIFLGGCFSITYLASFFRWIWSVKHDSASCLLLPLLPYHLLI